MYVRPNFKTKKALKTAVAADESVELVDTGLFPSSGPKTGAFSVEGPHYPAPHTWYARVQAVDGRVTKVLS